MQRAWCWCMAITLACVASVRGDEVSDGVRLAPRAFRAAVEKVRPSLVTIEAFGATTATGAKESKIPGINNPGDGPTTGVVLSADGWIVTSTFNFIRKQQVITVTLPDGSRKVAKLVGRDDTRKLCLLKVDGVSQLAVPTWAPAGDVRVGQWAITVGVGYGNARPAVSVGMVSATNRIYGRAVQTDANTSPANYGGPLLDIDGRVLGICVPLTPMSGAAGGGVEWYDSGIAFATPVVGLEKIIEQMKAGKTLEFGGLGVTAVAVQKDGRGAKVNAVLPKSPAEKAGVKVGDQLIAIDGDEIFDVPQMQVLLRRRVAGDVVQVKVKRGDDKAGYQDLVIAVTLEKLPDPPKEKPKPPGKNKPAGKAKPPSKTPPPEPAK